MIRLLLCALLICSGCAFKTQPLADRQFPAESPVSGKELEKTKKVHIDSRLMKPCSELPKWEGPTKPSDVIQQKRMEVLYYRECQERHRELIKILDLLTR